MEVPNSKKELNKSKELALVIYLTNMNKSFVVKLSNPWWPHNAVVITAAQGIVV